MNLTVYQFAYNESEIIEFIHEQWVKNLPKAKFRLIDNYSGDNSTNIAIKLGYDAIQLSQTEEKFSDERNMKWSNDLPGSIKDFVAIVDMDEVAIITQEQLEEEAALGTTIIRFEGWNIFNREENIGTRAPRFDKFIMFNHDKVKMNFGAGRHECYPKGEVKYSKKVYKLFHYGMWNLEYWLKRRELYNTRWSEKNLQMGWGAESRLSKEELIEKYNKNKEKAIKIL